MVCNTNIVVEDKTASSTGGQGVLVPAHHADSSLVAEHASKLGTFFDIPDLDFAGAETDTDVCAIA